MQLAFNDYHRRIVRDLSKYLVDKQDLQVDVNDKKYNSLDSLLRKIPWKDDFEIDPSTHEMLKQDKEPLVFNYSMPMDFEKLEFRSNTIRINLKSRLDFLRRRFKEDRDLFCMAN
jgi:hypothetical protein